MHSGDRNSMSERRESARRSRRVSAENTLGDDEYDLAAHAVSDGFRPAANNPPDAPSTNSPPSPLPTRFHLPNLPRSPPPIASSPMKGLTDFDRPQSTSKPPRVHDSLTLRNDGLESARGGQSSSSSSSVQGDDPYLGSTQPSHPYQMYPQRTYSNTTSSTSPSETLDGTRAPAHPYVLYTQSTTGPEDPTQQRIPIGFNGMGNGYHRQIGPDGEDAGDLIGPLGHMEELPPYSRYPEEPFQHKPAADDESNVAAATAADRAGTRRIGLTTSNAIQSIPGAGGIGLATRNPEFSSTEDLAGLPQGVGSSIRSRTSLESHHDINGAAQKFSEKPSPSKWQRRAKKKLWGVVPYWAICLLLSGIVIMGVVMGTVIGTIVTRHNGSIRKGKGQFDKNQPNTNDVVPLPHLPQGLPQLATGCFALPPMDKYQVPKACIKDLEQTATWNCDMPFRWYSMNVTEYENGTEISKYAMKLWPFDPNASKFIYGSQPPNILDFRPMRLVNDTEEINRGPAWFLDVKYNKTVIIREDQVELPDPLSPQRRWDNLSPFPGVDNSRFSRKGLTATEGDKPWICTWPNVTLQVFIYPNQTFTPPKPTSTSAPDPSMPSPFSAATPTPTPYEPQPEFKEPYPKLVKFVERRSYDSGDPAPATCTQYSIINGGQDKEPVLRDGKPMAFKVEEVGKPAKRAIMQRFSGPNFRDVFSLEGRDVELTPCGCVSFSWSV